MKKTLMVLLPMAALAGYVGYQRLTSQEQEIQLGHGSRDAGRRGPRH